MPAVARQHAYGPLRVEDVLPGGDYELSNGVQLLCSPAKNPGGRAQGIGAAAIFSDPLVDNFGTEIGVALSPHTLRAPDLVVLRGPEAGDWARTAPALAIEYADRGQDFAELRTKIEQLLAAGTDQIWVVRLTGPRRVEVYRPGVPMQVALPGQLLSAPGTLSRPVPVEALWDRDAAREHSLSNLLSGFGFQNLEDLRRHEKEAGRQAGRAEGMAKGQVIGRREGRREGKKLGEKLGRREGALDGERRALRGVVLEMLGARGPVAPEHEVRVNAENDLDQLRAWVKSLLRGGSFP